MEAANISGSITINLTPEYARQISWGKPTAYFTGGDAPLLSKIKAIPGVSGVWYTDDKNSELFATIKVRSPDEGEKIAATISGYKGVKAVQFSLGPAGPPPPPPSA
jgi:hypothetical protein